MHSSWPAWHSSRFHPFSAFSSTLIKAKPHRLQTVASEVPVKNGLRPSLLCLLVAKFSYHILNLLGENEPPIYAFQ